ncbi:MAG: substrate-binding domain-containing protein [Sphingomonadaceae bacterium]|nr:substrate-binding domain-containing protein [Sphingomonadaceae bacterium]
MPFAKAGQGGEVSPICPAMKKPTINDIIRLAGVSHSTVSLVLAREPALGKTTRGKIEQINAELGHAAFAGSGLPAIHRSKLIALVYDDAADDAAVSAAQEGIFEALDGTDFALATVHAGGEDPNATVSNFLEKHCPFGVIVLAAHGGEQNYAATIRAARCAQMHIASGSQPQGQGFIVSDDRKAVFSAVGYLVALGHDRIGFVSGPETHVSATERELGFLDALAEFDLYRDAQLIANGDYSFQSGLEAGKLLLDVSPRPTAVVVSNDEMAAGIVHEAGARSISIPDELSVIGFGDTGIAALIHPPLTTVRVPYGAMARIAVTGLIQPAFGESTHPSFVPELITRSSTAPAPV